MSHLEEAPEGDTRDILLWALQRYDESRARSLQSLPGASQIGGCRRQAFYRMLDWPEVNITSRLASLRGTAFHSLIEGAFGYVDPEAERFQCENEVPGYPGMGPAHVDFYDKQRETLTDWKTTLKKNLRWFPKQQQRWQIQIYGDALTRAGFPVKTVELLAIPVDGKEEDIRLHSEPFDPEMAQEGYRWLAEIYDYRDAGEIPPADFSGVICEQYCPFYGPDSCPGGGKAA